MPVRIPPPTSTAPPPKRGVTLPPDLEEASAAPEAESSGPGWGTAALAGGAALGIGGLLTRKPKAVWEGVKAVGRGASSLRQQLMLSGLALPKSVMGNVGATAIESIERGTMAPLKELFSMKTARDIRDVYKAGGSTAASKLDTYTNLPGPTPGRIMGSIDQATRNAMQRGGISAEDAERAVFQSPLPEKFSSALDNPVMKYLVPFRRTPINQLLEGGKTFNYGANTAIQNTMNAGSIASGAVHGAATSDQRFPTTVGVAAAGAAKYGLPYSMGALLGRKLAGGEGSGGLGSTAVPISEYGVESGVLDPSAPFLDPAGFKLIRRLSGGE